MVRRREGTAGGWVAHFVESRGRRHVDDDLLSGGPGYESAAIILAGHQPHQAVPVW